MYENHRIFETEVAGRKLVVETGKFAQLAKILLGLSREANNKCRTNTNIGDLTAKL